MLTTCQPVLPALTAILTHIDAQRATQDAHQATSKEGTLTEAQEASVRVYDDKIAKQVRASRECIFLRIPPLTLVARYARHSSSVVPSSIKRQPPTRPLLFPARSIPSTRSHRWNG